MTEIMDAQSVQAELLEQNQSAVQDPRAAGYNHRVAIAKRFGQRIASKDAVFMSGATSGMDMPRTISNGVEKPITGFNRWMLLQVMNDKGWKDSRFFTPQQIESSGWHLKQDAQPVVLQFVKTTDAKGMNLAIPEVQRFAVYNAALIDGIEPAAEVKKFSVEAMTAAMVDAGFEPGVEIIEDLANWVVDQSSGLLEQPSSPLLVQSMAVSAVLSHIDLQSIDKAKVLNLQKRWNEDPWVEQAPDFIAQDPASFFDAVRVAEQVSGQIVSLTRLAAIEHQMAPTSIAMEQAAADMQTTQAEESTPGPTEKVSAGLSAYQARIEEMFANRQAVLAVPYSEKDRASELGAVFYRPQKLWFIPQGADVTKFAEWDPRKHHLGRTASTDVVIAEFEKAMLDEGLDLEGKDVIPDGNWHNVRVNTKKGKNLSGAYLLDLKGDTPRGNFNNKHSGLSVPWVYNGPLLTPEQRAKMRAEALLREKAADLARGKTQDEAAVHAKEILAKALPAYGHGYVHKKGMDPNGLLQVPGSLLLEYSEFYGESGKSAIRPNKNYLVIPMHTAAGELRAVQAVGEDGSKSFMRGAQKKGTMTVLGADSLQDLCEHIDSNSDQLFPTSFVEGFATGASLWMSTGEPVVVCWDAGNLEVVVAEAAKQLPQNMVPVLAVDNDQFHVERALGYLSSNLGVNPNSERGSVVEVFSGAQSTRNVSLGDAVADGEWHKAPGGSYRMTLIRETDSTEVNGIEIEACVEGSERAEKMVFLNRGVEAGVTAMNSLEKHGHPEMLALTLIPEFRALNRRPTDWNDMHKLGGLPAVHAQYKECLRSAGLFKEPEVQRQQDRTAQRMAPTHSSGMER